MRKKILRKKEKIAEDQSKKKHLKRMLFIILSHTSQARGVIINGRVSNENIFGYQSENRHL